MENLGINKLSLEEKIAQMIIISLENNQITKRTEKLIQNYKIGGIILYKKNYSNYKQMLDLVKKIKQLNKGSSIPIFISLDQEGGRVNRMPSEFKNIRNAELIASKKDVELIKQSSKITSKMLLDTGINLNYAPVLDIGRFENENHAIGNRCYGKNKEDVSKYAVEYMKTMQKEGLISVVKHFPGHGSTLIDSHYVLPVVSKSKKELENEDMIPFENAIKEGADAIMLGHILAKDIDEKYPASLSKKLIHKYLIEKYKYKGLIITDDLKMFAIKLRYSKKKSAELAIIAGNNMIMMGYKHNTIEHLIKEIAKDVRKGKISEKIINENVIKIIEIKKKYKITDKEPAGVDISKINEEIQKFNEKLL